MKNITVEQDYCPKGWRQHIDSLLAWLDFTDQRDKALIVNQIKEKFGHLRFYTERMTEDQEALVTYVEHLCANTCTDCGSMKDVETKNITGWIYTLCEECMNTKIKEKNEQNN